MPAYADRGGWADPPGGWTFVEEWHEIPQATGNAKWDHNNGSDSYSENANTELFNDFEVFIAPGVLAGDVVRIETLAGVGETEDGINPAVDAIAMRLVDLGDPRVLGISDPSDRKIFFLAALHSPGELTDDPFIQGITYCARYRIFPIFPDPDIGASQALVQLALDPDGDGVPDGDGSLRFIPEASNRAHVGVGYFDPADNDNRSILVGTGYYTQRTLSILVNDKSEMEGTDTTDGDENVPILTNIDTTAFHTVWINAKRDANDPLIIHVRAFADGSLTPVEATIIRGTEGAVDRPNPEDLQDNAAWSGHKELSFNIGSAGTNAAGGFQYDYLVATMAGAFDPQPAGGSPVLDWEIH
ncbi:MAG: hypothetical protein C4527_08480 [Candidatus Omnitrophota bacterium]|nr:MAG: hypothetical protein C4527_08480 [Candidatus Omnitrophota bacterium]